METITIREALNRALRDEMKADDTVFLFGEDIGKHGGAMQVTANLFDEFGPKRVIDTPLSEYAIIGAGIGAAYIGLRPVVEIMFADFITLIADQLINNAAKACYTTEGETTCPMVIRSTYGSGARSGPHHSQSLEGMYMGIPGIKIAVPSNPADAYGLLRGAIRDNNPVLFLEPKMMYGVRGEVEDEMKIIPMGKARIAREGADVSVCAYGTLVPKALKAAEKAEKEGISVEVIDLRCIKPFDEEAVLGSVKKTGRAIIAQEACEDGGVAPQLATFLAEKAIEYLDGPILRVAAPNTPVPFSPSLEDYFVPSEERVLDAIRAIVVK
ncbi:MAG: alpha-ketoacid dehydrogenase subunit beta [Clostridia bacterium]|nr:alpha-ketoacid dehydrogenase subunit beta [Clostridia bacterium]